MASADFCHGIRAPLDALSPYDNMADLPGYGAPTFTLIPVGSTSQRSVQESGFTEIGLLTPLRRLYPLPVRQASALPTASFSFAVARVALPFG